MDTQTRNNVHMDKTGALMTDTTNRKHAHICMHTPIHICARVHTHTHKKDVLCSTYPLWRGSVLVLNTENIRGRLFPSFKILQSCGPRSSPLPPLMWLLQGWSRGAPCERRTSSTPCWVWIGETEVLWISLWTEKVCSSMVRFIYLQDWWPMKVVLSSEYWWYYDTWYATWLSFAGYSLCWRVWILTYGVTASRKKYYDYEHQTPLWCLLQTFMFYLLWK